MAAYYNEYDPKAAAWLRELIKQGHIADGVVDDRSIEDVRPTELAGFTQCHFFAGIGVWSYALRRAGWADDRPVWTGSCPCQPFSAAGKGAGFDDERHLWPAFHHLISQCRPDVVLGEQVASKDGLGWLDLVHADLEATGYASGAVDLCAAGVGAPHIRQRLWWVGTRLADTGCSVLQSGVRPSNDAGSAGQAESQAWQFKRCGAGDSHGSTDDGLVGLADTSIKGSQGRVSGRSDQGRQDQLGHGGRGSAAGGLADTKGNGWDEGKSFVGGGAEGIREGRSERRSADGAVGSMADTSGIGWEWGQGSEDGREHDGPDAGRQQGDDGAVRDNETGDVWLADTDDAIASGQLGLHTQDGSSVRQRDSGSQSEFASGVERPSPTNGHWRDADWLFCRDGKWRPVEPGTFPLAHGAAARVGRLRGYGNAIVAQAAQAFVESVMGE